MDSISVIDDVQVSELCRRCLREVVLCKREMVIDREWGPVSKQAVEDRDVGQ